MDLDPPGLVRPPDAKRDRDSAALELGTEARNYVGTGRAPARRRCGSRPRSPPRPRAQFMRCAQRDAVDAPGGASARRSPSARVAEARGVARRCSARRAKQPAATRPAHCRFRDKGGRQPRDDQVAGIGAIQQLTVDRAASAGGFRFPLGEQPRRRGSTALLVWTNRSSRPPRWLAAANPVVPELLDVQGGAAAL